MTKPMPCTVLPLWVAILAACLLTVVYFAKDTLVAETDQRIELWRYQFRVRLAVELRNVQSDSAGQVVDTLVEVPR